MSEWKLIGTAPKDRLIDLWCVPPDDYDEWTDAMPENGGIRITDASWYEADEILPHTGWVTTLDDGDWNLVEGPQRSNIGYPPWKPTHWMERPDPPPTVKGESE